MLSRLSIVRFTVSISDDTLSIFNVGGALGVAATGILVDAFCATGSALTGAVEGVFNLNVFRILRARFLDFCPILLMVSPAILPVSLKVFLIISVVFFIML